MSAMGKKNKSGDAAKNSQAAPRRKKQITEKESPPSRRSRPELVAPVPVELPDYEAEQHVHHSPRHVIQNLSGDIRVLVVLALLVSGLLLWVIIRSMRSRTGISRPMRAIFQNP